MALPSMIAVLVVFLEAAAQARGIAGETPCSSEDGGECIGMGMLQMDHELLKPSVAASLGMLDGAKVRGAARETTCSTEDGGECIGMGMLQMDYGILKPSMATSLDALVGAKAAGASINIAANSTIFMNGTAASKAVQLAMEAEMRDFPAACRKFVQWTLEEPPTARASSLRLDDVAIGLISGRQNFFGVAHRSILQYAPRGLIIRARGECPCSFRAALRVLRDQHPTAEWYYVGDEDAMIDLGRLVRLLGQYDPAVPTLIASESQHDICDTCGACHWITDQHGRGNTTDFYGGTGQIFSRGLVEALAPGLGQACREAEKPTLSGFGDLENTCATASRWQPSWRFVRLGRRTSTWGWFEGQKPDFVVAHHLCPVLIEKLAHVNRGQIPRHAEPVFVDNGANNGCRGLAK